MKELAMAKAGTISTANNDSVGLFPPQKNMYPWICNEIDKQINKWQKMDNSTGELTLV